jgi:hypothetical protein
VKISEIRIRCTPQFLARVHATKGRESLTSFVTWCIEEKLKDLESANSPSPPVDETSFTFSWSEQENLAEIFLVHRNNGKWRRGTVISRFEGSTKSLLKGAIESLKREGWSWVEPQHVFYNTERNRNRKIATERGLTS